MEDRQHSHVFWFFGVLVALGIENAATPVVNHFLQAPDQLWPYGLEALRLVVFLLVSVRFLLGAVVHFDEVRSADTPGSYGVDLVAAFVHFLLLFAWAFTIDANTGMAPFMVLMFCVIGYDFVWMIFCRGNTTSRAKGWAAINTLTLLLCLVAFFIALAANATQHWKQIPSILIVGLVSLLDLGEITSGKRYMIPKVVGWLNVDVPSSPDPPVDPSPSAAAPGQTQPPSPES